MAPLTTAEIFEFDENQVEQQSSEILEVLMDWDVVGEQNLEVIYKLVQTLQMAADFEVSERKTECSTKDVTISNLQDKIGLMMDDHKKEVDEKDKTISSLERECKSLDDELKAVQVERNALFEKMDEADRTKMKSRIQKSDNEKHLLELEKENSELVRINEELRSNLLKAQEDITEAAAQIENLKIKVQNSEIEVNELTGEKERLEYQMTDLKTRVSSKTDDDDQLMGLVNKRIEDWKVLLASKDASIKELQRTIVDLQQQLNLAAADADRDSVGVLTRAVTERDEQIEHLNRKLAEATKDIEKHANEIETVKKITAGKVGQDDPQYLLFENQKKLKNAEAVIKELESKSEQIEQEITDKDKKLFEYMERMQKYENGYGLRDAVEEIKHWKEEVGKGEKKLLEMSKMGNECQMQLNTLYDENEELRRKLGMGPADPVDMTQFKAYAVQQRMSDRLLNQILQKEIEIMEAERTELKSKLHFLANKIPKE